jgi:hypothetical protein
MLKHVEKLINVDFVERLNNSLIDVVSFYKLFFFSFFYNHVFSFVFFFQYLKGNVVMVGSLVRGTRAEINSMMTRSGNYTTIFIPADFLGVKKDHRSHFINEFLSSRPSTEKSQRLKNSVGNGAVVSNYGGRTLQDRTAAYDMLPLPTF